MRVENRDWGRMNPIDYVPVVGVLYRSYWCYVAKRGQRTKGEAADSDAWKRALRSEYGRLFVASGFTAALGVFVALGGTEGEPGRGLVPALTLALGGVFVHRVLSLAGVF